MYREIVPSGHLEHFVECYWTIQNVNHCTKQEISFPDGTIDLVFSLGDSYTRENMSEQRTASFTVKTAALVGQSTHGKIITPGRNNNLLSIRFKPFGLFPMLGIPMNELTEESLTLQEVMKNWGTELESRVFDAHTLESRIEVIENFLNKKVALNGYIDPVVRAAVSEILINRGNIRIETIYNKLGVSKSTLESKFKMYVGITPKELANIWRFNHAVILQKKNLERTLTEVGYMAGYFDQSHMIKDFKRYTGKSPKDFFSCNSSMNTILETGANNRFSGHYLPRGAWLNDKK
ncbi:MAG: helix-turn-helix transcriptional regulator [Chitinophagales bacterium]